MYTISFINMQTSTVPPLFGNTPTDFHSSHSLCSAAVLNKNRTHEASWALPFPTKIHTRFNKANKHCPCSCICSQAVSDLSTEAQCRDCHSNVCTVPTESTPFFLMLWNVCFCSLQSSYASRLGILCVLILISYRYHRASCDIVMNDVLDCYHICLAWTNGLD